MEVLNFKIYPVYERYYDHSRNIGIYKAYTHDEIEKHNGSFKDLDGNKAYSVVLIGSMQPLENGVAYSLQATHEYNSKFDEHQYRVMNVAPIKPVTLEEQKKFLETLISERQAMSLLTSYPNIVELILENKEVDLTNVKYVKEATFDKIKEKVIKNYADIEIINLLKPYGITDTAIQLIKKKYSNTALLKDMIKKNPYILTEVKGLGFKKVDKIALSINPDIKSSLFRAVAYITYMLSDIGETKGYTRISLDNFNKYIKRDIEECVEICNELIKKEKENPTLLKIKSGSVGLLRYYERELEIVSILKEINEAKKMDTSEIDLDGIFDEFKNLKGYELTDEQKDVVRSLITENVVIMTGNAGSGKSSSLLAAHMAFSSINKEISQCALSAKAAQRMRETTGKDAYTIHRTLGANIEGFTFNRDYRLSSDLVFIDEASMNNISVFYYILSAIKDGAKVLICFDDAQLPPIGAGNIAKDLLSSNFRVHKLTKVHRQAEASGILRDANLIRKGINPIKELKKMIVSGELKDQYYIFENDSQEVFNQALKYFLKSVDSVGVDNVCICVPRKENAKVSTYSFNNRIQQELLGHVKEQVRRGEKTFKLGAKVIQRENNPGLQVFNGDVGYVIEISKDQKMFKVDFGGKVVEFKIKHMEHIELAYALTCHLMQGSQYHTVITALTTESHVLLSNELLYTAMTRAEKRGLVVSQPKAFNYSCKTKASKRTTWLELEYK